MNSWLIHLEFNLKTEFQGLLADRIVDGTKIGSIATLQGPYAAGTLQGNLWASEEAGFPRFQFRSKIT